MKAPIGTHQSPTRKKSSVFSLQSAVVTLAAASVALLWLVTPAAPERLDGPGRGGLAAPAVPGAYHIPTTPSDGLGDRSVVAAAAAPAGVRVVILTGHR